LQLSSNSSVTHLCFRSGGVYCSLSPVSCLTVTSLGDSSRLGPPPAVPSMHLAQLAFSRCFLSKIKGHVVCFLLLQLQWSCSLCGSVYRQVLHSTIEGLQCTAEDSAVLHCTTRVIGLLELHQYVCIFRTGSLVLSLE
ncbi:hypothetical protein XENORESO_004272, partial [Xenotaenia resolanae]